MRFPNRGASPLLRERPFPTVWCFKCRTELTRRFVAWSKEIHQSRGYGAACDRIRKVVLKRDFGLCPPCRRRGLVTIAKEVDHIVNKAKAAMLRWSQARIDAESNLEAIWKPCHEAKTEEEQVRRSG